MIQFDAVFQQVIRERKEEKRGLAGAAIYRERAKRVLNLEPGQMVIPGIHDTHVHLLDGGLIQNTCLLFGLKTREAILEKLSAYAKENPGDSWLLGSGWSVALYPDSNPKKEELDRLFPDRPVWLLSDDGHSGWANSAALRLAGIDKNFPLPLAGRIERDPNTGEPTGTFRDAATELVDQISSTGQDEPARRQYLAGLDESGRHRHPAISSGEFQAGL